MRNKNIAIIVLVIFGMAFNRTVQIIAQFINESIKAQKAQLVCGILVTEDEWTEDQYVCEVRKSLVYNSTAAFALTDNLGHVVYVFTDGAYHVNREDVEALYEDFGQILDETVWKNHVQDKLKDSLYVESAARRILIPLE